MPEHPIANLTAIRRALLRWHARHALDAPWRHSRDPYHALVAAVMAQQTQMSRVLPSYQRFVDAFPTTEDLARASRGDVIRVWKGMGYNQRAVRLHRAATTIARDGWPTEAAGLSRIDGIGPFTAAIIASFAFDRPAACVDTNVVRVLTRLVGDDTLRGVRLQRLADAIIPAGNPARWNQALMDYGARICTSRPRCGDCVVARWCAARPRFESPLPHVAEEPLAYGARRPLPRFEHSPRYFRGRIIDLLRDLPPRRTLPLAAIAPRIANDRTPSDAEVAVWIDDLERAGLLVRRRDRVRLPD